MPHTFQPETIKALELIYEEMIWLSHRPNVSSSAARAWYTHIRAQGLKRTIRRFTGMVSISVLDQPNEPLVLEHFQRIQASLTNLIEKHRRANIINPADFINIIFEYEQVHIVTRNENYAAMRAKGDYGKAGIKLVEWRDLPEPLRIDLWKRKLRGNVANAVDFNPKTEGWEIIN